MLRNIMEFSTVEIKDQFEDLPEDNPDLVDVEELKRLEENDTENNFTDTQTSYSANVKSEFKEDNENDCITPENQIETTQSNSEKEDVANCNTNQKGQPKNRLRQMEIKCVQCGLLCCDKSAYKLHLMDHSTELPFKCDLCDKSFNESSSLIYHMSFHTETRRHAASNGQTRQMYSCGRCGNMYKDSRSFKSHLRHHTRDLLKCHLCEKMCANTNHLKIHLRSHTGEKPFECEICDRKFISKAHLVSHNRIHSTDRQTYKCYLCDKVLATKSSLRTHQILVHSTEKKHQCGLCEHRFKLRSRLTEHFLKHHSKSKEVCQQVDDGEQNQQAHLKCQICNRLFVKEHLLRVHLRSHSGERPYECEICNQGFIDKDALDSHRSTHDSNKRTYKCHLCDKVLATKKSMRGHWMLMHSTEKKHQCGLCEQKFKVRHLLTMHVRKHHSDSMEVSQQADDKEQAQKKPESYVKCQICNKLFAKEYYLGIHIKRHTEDASDGPPFKCDICDIVLKTRQNLKSHMMIHESNREKYKCDLCDKVYMADKHLRRHKKQKHSIENASAMNGETDGSNDGVCKICHADYSAEGLEAHMSCHDVKPFESSSQRIEDPTPFKCEICDKVFTRKDSLNRHKSTHESDRKTFKCDLCDKAYMAERHLRRHKRENHTKEKKYGCKLCGEMFQADYQLRRHLYKHNKEEVVKNHRTESNGVVQSAETGRSVSVCEICHVDCSAEGLEAHMSTHDVKPFKCECFQVFLNESEYKKHLKDDCEVVKSGLKLVENLKVENDVKEELEISFVGIKTEYDS